LRGDPFIGASEPFLQCHIGFPTQDSLEPSVVAGPTTDAKRTRDVPTPNLLAGDSRHDVHQLIDTDESLLAYVERLAVRRLHEALNTFDGIIDIAV
jgi:hypothetical protein